MRLLNQKGMTLLEVIVSIVILAFIALGITSITSNAGSIKDNTVGEDREVLQVEKAFYRFAFDFEQIYSPLFYSNPFKAAEGSQEGLSPEQIEARQASGNLVAHYQSQEDFNFINAQGHVIPKLFREGKDTFGFYTLSNRRKYKSSKESTYAWVLYKVEDRKIPNQEGDEVSTKAWVRYYSASNPFEAPIWKKTDDLKSQVLLTNIEKFKFSYWDPEKEKYVEDLKVIKGGENLIRGIKIEMTWIDRNDAKIPVIRFFKPAWDIFFPETDEEILKLQTALKQYGKKIETNGGNNQGGGQ